MKIEELTAPENYWNRELSWVEFNRRVLGEAIDKEIPLLERIKFLSITASNLDEFFMIRVASLKDMVNAGYKKKDIAGMTASEQLDSLSVATHNIVDEQYSTYNNLVKELKKYGVELPIIEQVNEVLFNHKPAAEAVKDLMIRDKKLEHQDLPWE